MITVPPTDALTLPASALEMLVMSLHMYIYYNGDEQLYGNSCNWSITLRHRE